MPSANGDSGTSSDCGAGVGGGGCGLASMETLTNVPNALDRSNVGDVGDLDCCGPGQTYGPTLKPDTHF